MRLAISKNSFHYRYYNVLRRMWGLEEENGSMTSLCTYSHFLFWITILSVLLSPFLITGWLTLKIGRALYKFLSLTTVGRKIVDWFDRVFGIGGLLETASDSMLDRPVFTLLSTTLVVTAVLAVIVSVPIVCIVGFIPLIKIICALPSMLAGVLMALGVFIVYIFWGIAAFLMFAGPLIAGFVSFCFSKILIFLTGIGLWILMVISALLIGSIITILLVRLVLSLEKVSQFITFKINGFHSARASTEKRQREEKIRREELRIMLRKNREEVKKKKISGEIKYSYAEKAVLALADFLVKCWKGFVKLLGFIKHIFFAKTAQVKGGTFKVMGGISLLWHLLLSIKDGVCPFVEFIDEKDLEKDLEKEEEKEESK